MALYLSVHFSNKSGFKSKYVFQLKSSGILNIYILSNMYVYFYDSGHAIHGACQRLAQAGLHHQQQNDEKGASSRAGLLGRVVGRTGRCERANCLLVPSSVPIICWYSI